jgi:hypothetical protein
MKIGISGSMHFTEQMIDVRDQLCALGHDVFTTGMTEPYIGASFAEREAAIVTQKMHEDAMREFWVLMQDADALLVLNLNHRGVKHYIGGNAFLEMGFAHVLGQKIFLWNPIPDQPYNRSEIEAMRPVVMEGDIGRVG